MTCIVGISHQGSVTIGGDSAGVSGYSITVRDDTKVFRNGPYLMGFTSSFRMGQLLHHAFAPPPPTNERTLDRFMVTAFVDSVRECLRDGGFLTTKNEAIEGGTFLVGVRGSLFVIESDFQVGRNTDGYAAIGCGQDIALGSLHTSAALPPKKRVKLALQAAAHHSAGVAAPFTIRAINT